MDPEVEARAREIVASAKAVRKPLPRGLWIAALVVGVACLVGAVLVFVLPAPAPTAHPAVPAGGGFGLGLGLGVAGGVIIGFVLGRRAR